MNVSRIVGSLVVAVIGASLVGVTVTLLSTNELFVGSVYTVPAIASLLSVVLSIVLFGAAGSPWARWDRTAYW